ncbi:MAG: TIGR02597 family protein [Luteolibacter sp.]|uniref:TIGR02597 family protein n=1 Tax=Luteolibacter sp. TaxID=1962973 RepID=UPI0032665306
MKTYIPYSLLLAAASCGLAHGAATAYTTPVGYVSLGNNGGVPAHTDMTLAIPLERSSEWAGTVASVSGNVITLTGTPGFTTNQWANATTPFVAKLGSGTKSGQISLITANAAGTLTVAFQNTDTLTGVVAGDTISIRKAWTIGNFFAGNTLPDNIEFSLFDITAGTDNAPTSVYYYFAGTWYDASDDSVATSVVLYPNEGFRLRNTTNGAISNLVVSGEVPTANSRIFIKGAAGSQDTRFSFFSSVDEPIATSGLGVADNDLLLSYSLTATGIDNAPGAVYYKFGPSWYDASDDSDVTATLKLKAGVGYVYRAAAATPTTTSSNTPDYVPSL